MCCFSSSQALSQAAAAAKFSQNVSTQPETHSTHQESIFQGAPPHWIRPRQAPPSPADSQSGAPVGGHTKAAALACLERPSRLGVNWGQSWPEKASLHTCLETGPVPPLPRLGQTFPSQSPFLYNGNNSCALQIVRTGGPA